MLTSTIARRIWKTALLPVIDFLALMFGAGVVYLVRYRWFEESFLGTKQIPSREYLLIIAFLSVVTVIIYAILGLYEIKIKKNFFNTAFKLGIGIFIVLLSIITFLFFNEYNYEALPTGVPISRFILATGGFFSLYSVALARMSIWMVEQIFLTFGIGKINVVLISDPDRYIANWLLTRHEVGTIAAYNYLDEDNTKQIIESIQEGNISEIYLFSTQSTYESEIANIAERHKVQLVFSPGGFTQYDVFGMRPLTIGEKVFLEIRYSNLDGWWVVIKRLFDIIASGVGMILLSPLYVLIALAIFIDSPGPVFYRSDRVGPNGKPFKLWKFRRFKTEFNTKEGDPKSKEALEYEKQLIKENNMKKDNVLYKIKDDPRRTRVGKFIEKYSLDELPQLFNVFIGNMSLVGPRPHQPREVEKYLKHHYKVLNIKPGVTGLAQVNGRSDLSFEEEVRYDTFYVERWNFLLDIWIIIKTPFIVLFNSHQS
jgi:exopolysaccharide biosynthesis polyprenyl glycosylphosphotransferase